MRLSKIKLSGFKSFVDATTLSFPSNLMGIVGPNGCGKSNIIDAIRWVLGESSAKMLRGDSMADVIFNGSSERKPVGQASIELVFDNSDGQITGSYAGFAEISMRRVVTRDGTSQYFLNNSRCRRKDITNLLLGTGVGSHGYSIIEQGMISRLVEAKPEDMRAFLEEAAGISKYKERRRETEHRIRHTRDNLERLQDLRDELEKQLGHLQRQARAAERFKVLKADQRKLEAELLVLRLRGLESELADRQKDLSGRQTELDAAVTRQGEVEANIEKLRVSVAECTEDFNKVQGVYYRIGADIARLEQSIQHRNSDIQRQSNELEQSESQLEKVSGHISDDEVELEKLDQLLGRLNPELEEAQQRLEASEQTLRDAEREAESVRDRAEAIAAAVAEAERTIRVEEARLEHQEERLRRIEAEREEKRAEFESIETVDADRELDELTAREERQRSEYEAARRALEVTSEDIVRLRKEDSSLGSSLDESRERLQRDKGRLSSLEALQEAALGRVSDAAESWLQQAGRQNLPRLATRLQVEAGWENAVESILAGYLNSIESENLDSLAADLEQLGDSGIAVLEPADDSSAARMQAIEGLVSLADKVLEPSSARNLLAGVFGAPSIEAALAARRQLGPGQSVVTMQGVLVTRHALKTNSSDDPQLGVIARGDEIEKLRVSITALTTEVETAASELAALRRQLEQLEATRASQHGASEELQQVHAELRAKLETRRSQRAELQRRIESLESELTGLEDERHSVSQAMNEARSRIAAAESEMSGKLDEQQNQQSARDAIIARLTEARTQANVDRERVKEIAIMVESRRSSMQSASAALERVQAQKQYLIDRKAELVRRIDELKAPLADERKSLETQLDERLGVEESLAKARSAVEACDQQLREAEESRVAAQQSVNKARDAVESNRMAVREIEVRADTVKEQFSKTEANMEQTIAELPEEATTEDWTQNLEAIDRKIQRLGPINLAAIDEYEEQSERKEYLDKQNADLTDALETLEAAIRKIDAETRSRFRDTFTKANQGLGELFPRLFGGGQAHLELDSEDLLTAGVTVMARPPGKRISTIHLMSGGEKALTAVALVFAIFKLNPAPFCLLDEVDAPLDDANVGRFSEIVREMSDQVQFVLITHNKTTMEAMNQLAGVTMHEPGVSRLVAVDIDEAVQLAAM